MPLDGNMKSWLKKGEENDELLPVCTVYMYERLSCFNHDSHLNHYK